MTIALTLIERRKNGASAHDRAARHVRPSGDKETEKTTHEKRHWKRQSGPSKACGASSKKARRAGSGVSRLRLHPEKAQIERNAAETTHAASSPREAKVLNYRSISARGAHVHLF
ncbi:MAG: hypothetical protein E6Q97_03320 [Desulfurellales bacterium]|nr:MAG: hypothetical protein E6Q97_03320 [Desulfurellales bacterium]